MATRDYSTHGNSKTYNAECMRCGHVFKADEMELEWTGLFVCKQFCYEARHPQDFVKGVIDDMSVPLPSPGDASTPFTIPDPYVPKNPYGN